MALNGFTSVPAAATMGGAPIDAYQADAFRRNDELFEKWLQSVLVSPLIPSGYDAQAIATNPEPYRFVNAREIEITSPISLAADQHKIPIIWFARDRIVLKETINVAGKGAQPGEHGDFGGSGGFGTVDGQPCRLPYSGVQMFPGGITGTNAQKRGQDLSNAWASRALPLLAYCRGGAAGGNDGGTNGGAGGGVVVLCAPTIQFEGANAKIDASGADGQGGGNTGGGGGGLVVLIAKKIIGSTGNVDVSGGQKQGTGGDGGNGLFLEIEIK